MEETYLNNLTHDLSFRPGIIKEALARGVKFGSKEFFVYSQLRFYETDGKFGFCVAGDERLGEDVGMSPKEVSNALNRLRECGLVEHIWCDKRVYRNKTKLWVSTVRLAAVCTNVDAIRVLNKGAKNISVLGKTTSPQVETTSPQVETTSPQVETTSPQVVASPVTTEVGNTNRNTKRNRENAYASSADADSAPAPTPFSSVVNNDDEKSAGTAIDLKPNKDTKENKRIYAICSELLSLMQTPVKVVTTPMKSAVKARLDDGYTEEELKKVARWSATQQDKFYRIPHSLFSEKVFPSALVEMDNDKPKYTTMRTI